jgi:hypothetical protein
MLAGALLMVVGLGLRFGIVALPGPVPGPTAGPSIPSAPPVVAAVATAAVASPSPDPGNEATAPVATASATAPAAVPSPTAAPSADPSPVGSLWFADDFDAVSAWPDGRLEWLTTSVRGGAYRIESTATDLPVFVFAAAGEGAPAAPLVVAAELALGPGEPASAAGIALEAADGTRLAAMVSGDGRVTLLRDSFVQLDQLAAGSIDPPSAPVRLRLALDGEVATVSVDGVVVARAREPFEPIAVGLAVWAGGPTRVEVLRYEVWSDARS